MRKLALAGFLLSAGFLLPAPPLAHAEPISYSCSVFQGFDFQPDVHDIVGHASFLKIGSETLSTDFAIFDLDRERKVAVEEQIGVEWTLYEGMQAVYPERVLVRGQSVVRDGKLCGKRGDGEFCVPVVASLAAS